MDTSMNTSNVLSKSYKHGNSNSSNLVNGLHVTKECEDGAESKDYIPLSITPHNTKDWSSRNGVHMQVKCVKDSLETLDLELNTAPTNNGTCELCNTDTLDASSDSLNENTNIIISKESLSQDNNLAKHDSIDVKSLKTLNITDKSLCCPVGVRSEDVADNIVSASNGICYARYNNEMQMPAIMHLITKDLSEPYSIYTYRYFIHNWPQLCYLAIHESTYVGAIVCKLDLHKKITRRGYIAMLAVDESARRRKIGTNLVKMAIESMTEDGCDEVVLETEVTNHSALHLYENLGFVRDKRLFRYYLNGVDALRLKLWLT
ncbi:unnamed protein product [Clavelina lepadiformis]|uniref:N-acetyltransferase domain-containing protein n=1 Tax=Clavelina lepadiformis TaxID=159417 RepID=A0ABP0FND5_CLALP